MFYINVKFSKYIDFTLVMKDNAFVLKYTLKYSGILCYSESSQFLKQFWEKKKKKGECLCVCACTNMCMWECVT